VEPVSSAASAAIDTGAAAQNQLVVTNEDNTLHIVVNGQHAGEFAFPGAKEGLPDSPCAPKRPPAA